MNMDIPYGSGTLSCDITPDYVLHSHIDQLQSSKSGAELVADALRHPIGSMPLSQLAAGKKTAVIIISDHTRPVPSREILPNMLAEMRKENPEIQITLLVATGCHRKTTSSELRTKLGDDIFKKEHIIIHDAFNPRSNVKIGVLPSGAPLVIDRTAFETDLLTAEGFIEPHFFAGFSGGRKSILPGICDKVTVYGNHCGRFINSPFARTGILEENPIHNDMEAAARLANLQFITNVVINDAHRTVAAFCGDAAAAHAAGVALLRQYCEVHAKPSDIVLTSNGGSPLDQNLYQCVKGLTSAESAAKPGATLIMCAELADGIGGEGFYQALKSCSSPASLMEKYINTPQSETVPDQWQSQILCRILKQHRVIIVTRKAMAERIIDMKMEYASSIDIALKMAGPGTVTVIPNGISVIIRQE